METGKQALQRILHMALQTVLNGWSSSTSMTVFLAAATELTC